MSSSRIIIEHRKLTGLTQEKLAEKIHVSRQTIAMWETQRQFPTDNVAILAARYLNIEENELLDQLRWDKLHQRVEQLEKRYNATITAMPRKEQKMDDLSTEVSSAKHKEITGKIATQALQGVTLSVKRICKSINPEDPRPRYCIRCSPGNIQVDYSGEVLIVHMLCENSNDAIDLKLSGSFYIEDNLGNWFCAGGTAHTDIGESIVQMVAIFGNYASSATSFNLRYDTVNRHEDDCDALLFENVPLDGKGISKSLNGDMVIYNGGRQSEGDNYLHIHFALNHPLEVRHVGVTKVNDNLGNQYLVSEKTRTSNKGAFSEQTFGLKGLHPLHPEATSISFKYLLARTILSFELQDLPLPS